MISVCYPFVFVSLLYYVDLSQNSSLYPITAENQDEILTKSVSPYANMTYDEQLKKKQNISSVVVDMILNCSGSLNNVSVIEIIPSPVTKAYRNRDLFSIKRGVDGNLKTVGCVVSNLSLKLSVCVRPTKVDTMKESHKRVAQVYEDFIRLSPIPPYVEAKDGGHWGPILVRSNEAGEVMAAVTVQSRGYTYKVINGQLEALKKYFLVHLPNITLFHQQCKFRSLVRCTHAVAPYKLLYGIPYLVETLNGYKFIITPDSFFQINKMGAEVLYNTIMRAAKLTHNTTVLDLFSGTGAISIMVSKIVKNCIGIEINAQAVRAAINGAKYNKIYNVNFVHGRVENALRKVLYRCEGLHDIVPILHPSTKGVALDVIRTIKGCPQISRVIYICCKPGNAKSIRSIAELCSEEGLNPFRLTEAISVDTHPQTALYELILMFERSPLLYI